MPNKPPSSKFAEIIPTGVVAIICGIVAVSVLFQNLIIACLVGTIGIVVGIATLRLQVEKLDKIFAVIGINLSFVPMIYAVAIFV
ncbi:MAG: hypothetical protein L0287_12580 [Anaerolineae bacterium]|nr:hypothetical protein [Anaerolineae bacterium]MCI0610380.1 hypothetical protein [Anaerolineae bacterium]